MPARVHAFTELRLKNTRGWAGRARGDIKGSEREG